MSWWIVLWMISSVGCISRVSHAPKLLCVLRGHVQLDSEVKQMAKVCDMLTPYPIMIDANTFDILRLKNDEELTRTILPLNYYSDEKRSFIQYLGKAFKELTLILTINLKVTEFEQGQEKYWNILHDISTDYTNNGYHGFLLTYDDGIPINKVFEFLGSLMHVKKNLNGEKTPLMIVSVRSTDDWANLRLYDSDIDFYILPTGDTVNNETPRDVAIQPFIPDYVDRLDKWVGFDFRFSKGFGASPLNFYCVQNVDKKLNKVTTVWNYWNIVVLLASGGAKVQGSSRDGYLMGTLKDSGKVFKLDTITTMTEKIKYFKNLGMGGVVYYSPGPLHKTEKETVHGQCFRDIVDLHLDAVHDITRDVSIEKYLKKEAKFLSKCVGKTKNP